MLIKRILIGIIIHRQPKQLGIHVFKQQDLSQLVPSIDWTPFFQTWQLAGKYPAILTDPIVGNEAQQLYNDAQQLLKRIIAEQWLQARAVVGLFAAQTDGDDLILQTAPQQTTRLHHLRQQSKRAEGLPDRCLSDFVAPYTSGKQDYVGAFALTAGIGIETSLAQFQTQHDDYSAILLKALADRLAEAFAEYLPQKVRTELWAYAPNEQLDNSALIAEQYTGIRPAPGYPACPGPYRETPLVATLRCRAQYRYATDRQLRYVSRRVGIGLVFQPPRIEIFYRGTNHR